MVEMVQQKFIGIFIFLASCNVALSCRGTLLATGITADEKRLILLEHNKLRQLVATGGFPGQPAAENMQEIVWDDELAARAQEWANNCEFRHDPHRTIKRFTMGQNLAVIWSTAPLEPDDGDFPSRINNWFNEVQKYTFGASWSPKTGHYSQLVWGETNLIGCGYSEYKDRSKYNKLYVCNYGPGGNVVGYNPYEVGRPSCRTYGMKPSPRYKGLCMDPSLAPISGALVNKIETYEYKQNTFNTKTSYTGSQFNNQQPQQAKTQQQSRTPPILSPSQSTTLPALISSLLQHEPLQSKILPQHLHLRQLQSVEDNKGQVSLAKNSIGEQSILRAILNPTPIPSSPPVVEELLSTQEEQQEIQLDVQQGDERQEQLQELQGQEQNKQEDEVKTENQDVEEKEVQVIQQTTPSEILTSLPPTRKTGWNLLTWRG